MATPKKASGANLAETLQKMTPHTAPVAQSPAPEQPPGTPPADIAEVPAEKAAGVSPVDSAVNSPASPAPRTARTQPVPRTSRTSRAMVRSAPMTEALQSNVAARTNQGHLVQVRVQPDEVGKLANRIVKQCSAGLGVNQGQVMGVLLLVAFSQPKLLFATLESAYAGGLDEDSRELWEMIQRQLSTNPLLRTYLEADVDADVEVGVDQDEN
jgi:hypothetical protein